jgi:hypothetical protein
MLISVITKEEHAALPESDRAHYVAASSLSEADRKDYGGPADGYILGVKGAHGFELKPVAKLLSALDKQRAEADAASAKLKAIGDLDPEAARKALKLVEDWKKANPEEQAKKAYEAALAKAQEDHAKVLEGEKARRSKIETQLQRQLTEGKARDAITRAKGSVDLLLPIVTSRIKTEIDEASGEMRDYVVDEFGNKATMLQGSSMVPATIDHLIEALKQKDSYAPAFAGSGARGSGGSGGNGGGGGRFTIAESVARNDPREYQRVRAEAEKAGQQIQVVAG